MRASGIIFDVYGTLFDVAAVSVRLGEVTARPDELSRLWRAKQLEYSFVRSLLGDYVDFDQITAQAIDFTLESHQIVVDDGQRRRLLDAWLALPLFPDVRPAIERFRTAGIPLVILSNGSQAALDILLERARIAEFFTAVLSSEAVRVYKPDHAIYQLAADRLEAPADELIFVSANGFDIAGARRFGFTVVRIDRTGAPLDRFGSEPHHTVADFDELVRLLLADAS